MYEFFDTELSLQTVVGTALPQGQTLYGVVRVTNRAGLQSVSSSDGVLVDTTAPACTLDLEPFTSGGPRLPLGWACVDPESGVQAVSVAIGTTRGHNNVLDWTRVADTGAVPLLDSILLAAGPEQGAEYFVTLRADSVSGARGFTFGDGVVYDTTAPTVQGVLDGDDLSDDADYSAAATIFSASWNAGDDETPIVLTEIAIGTRPGDDDVMPFSELAPPECVPSDVNSGPCITAVTSVKDMALPAGVEFQSGTVYFVAVRVTNLVALSSTGTSDGFLVDLTPPVCEFVRDGHGETDIDFLQTLSVLRGAWRCDDPETGTPDVEWGVKAVDKVTGSAAIVNEYVSSQGATQAATADVVLTHGTQYLWSVIATNRAGSSVTVDSDGVTIDSTPPVAGRVRDIAEPASDDGSDMQFTSVTVSLAASWDSFGDPESGIATYQIGWGTAPGRTDVVSMRDVGSTTSYKQPGVFLSQFATYYATVVAVSGAGGRASASSNGFTTDATPPLVGEATMSLVLPEGFRDQPDYPERVTGSVFVVSWVGFRDVESRIDHYEVAIGTGTTTAVLDIEGARAFSDVGNVFTADITGMTVEHDTTYHVTVKAVNSVGLTSQDTAPPHTVLLGDVVPGAVTDGSVAGEDVDYQESLDSVWAAWTGFSDPAGGDLTYEWQVSSSDKPGQPGDVFSWTVLSGGSEATSAFVLERLDLEEGTKYYVHVRATSSVTGTTAVATSDGFVADNTAPQIAHIGVGGAGHLAFTTLPVWANWEVVDGGAPITKYEIGFGTMSGSTDIVDFTDVGKDTNYQVPAAVASFPEGAAVFAVLRTTNAAGLVSVASSAVSVVDTSPPSAGHVDDGGDSYGEDMDLDAVGLPRGTMVIAASWRGWQDDQSPVNSFSWCVGTREGQCDILPMDSVGSSNSAARDAGRWWLNFEEALGEDEVLRYYTTVVGCNAVDMCETSVSNGVIVDLTGPVAGSATVGLTRAPLAAPGTAVVGGNPDISVAFSGFSDPETGISKYVSSAGRRVAVPN